MEEKNIKKVDKLTQYQKYVLYFFIYAILGWIIETIFCLVTLGEFHKRGFLYGPLCPIYGFGAVILIVTLKRIKTNFIGKFFISCISFTAFEYVVSVVLEALFGLRWWDYTGEVLNFQGRISVPYSIAWGIMGVIFVQNIHPYVSKKVDKILNKITIKTQKLILTILVATIIIDTIFSIIKYI